MWEVNVQSVSSTIVLLPCSHPSVVKLHSSSGSSHDTDTPFWLDTCTKLEPLLTSTPLSLWNAWITVLLQFVFTCKRKSFKSDLFEIWNFCWFAYCSKHACPLCWMLMVLLFISITRRFCGSEVSSSVNEGFILTSWAITRGHEAGSSNKCPSNVTTNWSATNRAWSFDVKDKDEVERGRKIMSQRAELYYS